MTPSPCCGEYKFPLYQGEADSYNDKLELSNPMAALSVASPLLNNKGDYFALDAPTQVVAASPSFNQRLKPAVHQAGADSISSLNSDATLAGSTTGGSGDFSNSTDTLVFDPASDSPKLRRNVLLLRLTLSHRSTPKLFLEGIASARTYESFPKIEEELPTSSSQSAVDSRFTFGRRSSTDDGTRHLFKSAPQKTPSTSNVDILPSFNVPKLRKQTTLPNLFTQHDLSFVDTIKTEQAKRSLYVAPAENMREAILGLSPTIKYLPADQIAALLETQRIDARTQLPSLFVIDIRSFADFVKGNVSKSINVCPPLTLLRRSTFNWTKCVNSLPNYERLIILNYLHHNNENAAQNTVFDEPTMGLHGLAPIFIYDNNNYSANLYHMCKKLVDHSCWDAESAPPIYLLDGTYSDFASRHRQYIISGKVEHIDLMTLLITSILETQPGKGADDITVAPLDTSFKSRTSGPRSVSISGLFSVALETSTPSVSNFSLPQNLPQKAFKIRHNEEVLGFGALLNVESPVLKLTATELELLPEWLRNSLSNPDRISDDFHKLEVCEKLRLNNALSLVSKPELHTPGGSMEVSPIINCGLDYGHKNRYKDIFLYDHTRVKLRDESQYESQPDCDYINASYVNPTSELMDLIVSSKQSREQWINNSRIIATQGPLQETIGDFWRCVVDEHCLLIVSLTEEYEGGLNKCSAYWTPGVYKSGQSELKLELVKKEEFGQFLLRSFLVTEGQTQRRVLQVQLNRWQDMSVSVDPRDILAIVSLKEHILSLVKPEPGYSTITHCSAGCGRTGVFCAVDSLIGILRYNNNRCELPYDPVYETVNNLRRQRILMVQTMRQYSLVYDVLVQYALVGATVTNMSERDIVKEFLKDLGM